MSERHSCCKKCERAGHFDRLQCAMHHSDEAGRLLWIVPVLLLVSVLIMILF